MLEQLEVHPTDAAATGDKEDGAERATGDKDKADAEEPKPTTRLPPFLTLGKKEKTAQVLIVSTLNNANYGMNFNGYAKGGATFTVPTGWTVEVTFRNNSPVPHSVVVVEEGDTRKLQFKEPCFENAATPDFKTGTVKKEERFSFVVDEEGDYAFACGFPAHAAAGHWIRLTVSDEAKTATWAPGE